MRISLGYVGNDENSQDCRFFRDNPSRIQREATAKFDRAWATDVLGE